MSDEQTPETGQQVAVAEKPRLPKAPLEAQAAGVLPIIPTNIEEAQRYATGLIAAGIVPDAFKFRKNEFVDGEQVAWEGQVNAPLVLMGVLKAMEVGVAPQTGLGGLLPINGRFTVWGDLAAALVQNGGKVANQTAVRVGPAFDPEDPMGNWPPEYGWEVRYWRIGQPNPYIGRFTVRDAKRANLWMNTSRKPWIMYPDRMLFNRARAFALRDGFADALSGLSIAEEVIDSLPPPEAREQAQGRLSALLDDEPDASEVDAPETVSEAAGAEDRRADARRKGED